MTDKTGGPAYPVVGHMYEGAGLGGQLAHGMTLLDYFAGLAMQGILSSPLIFKDSGELQFGNDWAADMAYQQAAAMLRARAKYLESDNE